MAGDGGLDPALPLRRHPNEDLLVIFAATLHATHQEHAPYLFAEMVSLAWVAIATQPGRTARTCSSGRSRGRRRGPGEPAGEERLLGDVPGLFVGDAVRMQCHFDLCRHVMTYIRVCAAVEDQRD